MKIRTPSKRLVISLSAGLLWLALDLTAKLLAVRGILNGVRLIDGWLVLTLYENTGVAFGISLGYAPQLVASVVVLVLLGFAGFRILSQQTKNPFLNALLLGIIMGGATGNLLDRIFLGHVIDFIALKPFPVFNIADIGITLGLIALLALNLKNKPQ